MTETVLYDLRTIKRNLDKGLITEADYNNYLKKLADSKENLEDINIEGDEEIIEMPSSKDF